MDDAQLPLFVHHRCSAYCTETEHATLFYTTRDREWVLRDVGCLILYDGYLCRISRIIPATEAPPLAFPIRHTAYISWLVIGPRTAC